MNTSSSPLAVTLSFSLTQSVLICTEAVNDIHALTGYSSKQLLSGAIAFEKIIHPDDLDITGIIFSHIHQPQQTSLSLRIFHKNGQIKILNISYLKLLNNEQQTLIELSVQVPAKLEFDETKQTAQGNFIAMLENTDDYIYFKNRDHIFTGASQTLVDITEHTKHWTDLIGKTDYDIFSREYADTYYTLEKQIFNGNLAVAHDIQPTLDNDGNKGWVDNRKYPIKDNQGTIIGLFGIARDITQLKLTEHTLHKSESRLKKAQYVANIGTWEHNITHNELIWSDGIYHITEIERTNYPPSYSRYAELIHPDDSQRVDNTYLKAIQKHKAYELNFRLRFEDGEIKYIHERGEFFYNAKGIATKAVGSLQDITTQQRPKELLTKLNHDFAHFTGIHFYQAICQHIAKTMCLDYVFIGLTSSIAEEVNVIAGWGLGTPIAPFSYALIDTPCAEVLGRKACIFPEQIQNAFPKDDLLIQMGIESYVGIPLLDSKNKILGILVALHSKPLHLANDINELFEIASSRISSEILREQVLLELKETQLRFHHVAEQSRTFLWEVNAEGLFTYCSAEVITILGFLPEELIGKKYFYDLFPKKVRSALKKQALANMQNKQAFNNYEHQVSSKSGEFFWVSTSGQAITDKDGKFIAYQGGYTDITERKNSDIREHLHIKALEIIATGKPLGEILQTIVLNVEQEKPTMICSILLLADDGKHLYKGAAPSLPDFYNQAIHWLEIGDSVGSCGTASFLGQRVIAEDLQTHPYWSLYTELTKKAGLGACWSQPIFDSKNNVLGTFGIYHHTPQSPSDADLLLIEQTAYLAGIAIEKDKINQALKLSTQRWRFALEGTGGAVWEFNLQTQTNMVSRKMFDLLGFKSPASLQNFSPLNSWQDRLHPDSLEPTVDQLTAVINQQTTSYYIEQQVKHENGHYIWLLSRGLVVNYTSDNKPLLMIGVSEDISERKQAELTLQLAASVFSHAREGIIITDASGIIIDVNRTFSEITGYEKEDVFGKNPSILQSGRQSQDFYKTMWKALLDKGHWYSEVWNRKKNGEVYAEMLTISAVKDKNNQVNHYVALFTDITTIKEHQQQLEHIAHYDVLTQLPNRVLFADRLSQAMVQTERRNKTLAVVFLDLDGFKAINDNYGHDVGDKLLVTVAKRMEEALREGDTIARFGGDEFIAVLTDLEKIEDCEPVLERLLTAASDVVTIDKKQLHVSTSIGITTYPQDNVGTELLVRHADQAMYIAKQSGKNRYHLFDTVSDNAVKIQREGIENIRTALKNQEFVLHYQPKVNIKTNEVIGAEALIRWQHPEKGLIPPLEFLPIIDDHNLSIEVGNWVIKTALEQISSWKSQAIKIPISVNIGALQLQQTNFPAHLAEFLAMHPDAAPCYLELEVLETSALGDMVNVSSIMNACCKLGVKFSLDDFGTGYSSLAHLKRLPANCIKIDQSFVCDMLVNPDDLAIIEGVIGLAKAFKREIIAEGVETIEQGNALMALGCNHAQGYAIAKPMPANEIPNWIKQWQSSKNWS